MISKPWRAFRNQRRLLNLACSLALLCAANRASAADAASTLEPASCQVVRLADVGWTDVTATTAVLSHVLRDLGYQPRTTLLSVPVTFASMKSGNIDVFLGNWMPAQTNDRRPFMADGSIQIVATNLTGARYTLAVPAYAHAAGLHDFSDIQRFAAPLNRTIYGIEAGNDGNHHVLDMIRDNQFGLGTFHLVESSEQGMLAEVARAYTARRPIVFLAWDPHPMNMRFDLRYLTGGDATFGPNFGGASVLTLARTGYTAACPNIAHLLVNLAFTPRGESEIMLAMTDAHLTPEAAATQWLSAHPEVLARWLKGVTRFDGRPPDSARAHAARLTRATGAEQWLTEHKLPIGDTIAVGIAYLRQHGTAVFAVIAAVVGTTVAAVNFVLRALPAPLVILAAAVFAWVMQRSLLLAAFVTLALLFIVNQGYWQQTLETVALVFVATVLATGIGVPVGIAAAHHPRFYAALRPVLDLMQTLPTFVLSLIHI